MLVSGLDLELSERGHVSKQEDGQGCATEHEGKSSTFP